jgi:hypothetical protein
VIRSKVIRSGDGAFSKSSREELTAKLAKRSLKAFFAFFAFFAVRILATARRDRKVLPGRVHREDAKLAKGFLGVPSRSWLLRSSKGDGGIDPTAKARRDP